MVDSVSLSTSRRTMLAGMGLVTLAGLGGCATVPVRNKPFFEEAKLPIGLQTYTLGEEAGKDLDATFAQVAAIGFGEIELPGLYGRSAAEVRRAADKAGLAISCMHIPMAGMTPGGALTLASSTSQIVETAQTLGITEMVVPIMKFPADARPREGETFLQSLTRGIKAAGPDLWKETADALNESAAALKPHGIALGYHNHNVEFMLFGAETGWDILIARTDPALVQFEVDVGWIAASGRDPVSFFGDHIGRVRWMHVKDIAAGTSPNTALQMIPAEVGYGTLDWRRILPAAHAAGVRRFYLEQEPPFTMARIDAARKGYQFLETLVV
ncbi:MAG: sugar phosphate isomerase/epimerase [Sphingomonadaceae bacterium]